MQAIEVKGAARRATTAGDWFRLAMSVAMLGLGLGSLLLATATGAGRDSGQVRSIRQWVQPAAPASTASVGYRPIRVTHGNLPGDDAAAGPATDAPPIQGLLP